MSIENAICIRDSLLSRSQMIEVETCDRYIKEHFEDISKTVNFKHVGFSYLLDLIESSDLVVEDEKQMFDIVVEWIEFDISSRRENGFELLKRIRFPLIPKETLSEIQSNELMQSIGLLQRIAETFHYLNQGEFREGQNTLQPVDITSRKYKNSDDPHLTYKDYEMFFIRQLKQGHRKHGGSGGSCPSGVLATGASGADLNEEMEYLICFGGENNNTRNTSVEISNNETDLWGTYNEMDQSRSLFAAVSWKDFVILLGGFGLETNCTKYDLRDRTYTEMPRLTANRREHGAAIIGSELYVSGGFYTLSSVDSLDLNDSSGQWIVRESMWHKRTGHAVCSFNVSVLNNRRIFCLGGKSLTSCESYNPQTKKWKLLASMKKIRSFAGCCHDRDKFIYVAGQFSPIKVQTFLMFLGGRDDVKNKIHSTMERYDITTNQWSILQSSIDVGLSGCTMTNLNGNFIVVGGKDEQGVYYKTVHKYSTETDTSGQRHVKPELGNFYLNQCDRRRHVGSHQIVNKAAEEVRCTGLAWDNLKLAFLRAKHKVPQKMSTPGFTTKIVKNGVKRHYVRNRQARHNLEKKNYKAINALQNLDCRAHTDNADHHPRQSRKATDAPSVGA
ncbi:Kelch-like protein 20 [Nymphon striatum]|nr:Kelch-like protein 20 [Nymphon striatum]